MLAALLLIALLPARPVRIDAQSSTDGLRARLAMRLLEEGHLILPPSARGGITLRVETSTGSSTVEVAGRQSVREHFPIGSQLAELELLHFASTHIDSVGETSTPRSDELRVSIDLVDVDAAEAVRAAVILGLLDGGFAVAPPSEIHQVELCISAAEDALAIWSVRGKSCERTPPPEAAKATTDQLRAIVAIVVRHAPAPGIAIAPSVARAAPADGEPLRIEARVSGGTTVGPIGPIVGLSLGLGLAHGIGGALDTLLSSSSASGRGRIYELWTVAGPALPIQIADPLELRLALAGGLLWHRFQLDRVGSGDRFDAALLASVRLAWLIDRSNSLDLALLGGASTRGRVHAVDGGEVWRREPWFFAALLGFTWGTEL